MTLVRQWETPETLGYRLGSPLPVSSYRPGTLPLYSDPNSTAAYSDLRILGYTGDIVSLSSWFETVMETVTETVLNGFSNGFTRLRMG